MLSPRFLIFLVVGAAVSGLGCNRDLGECNLDGTTDEGRPIEGPAAFDLAFREVDGLPMYEGQALIQTSCGAGQFCHAPAAERADRFGVPAGLNFDLDLACTDASVDSTCSDIQPCDGTTGDSAYCERLDRLDANRSKLGTWAGQSIQEIRAGTMPPGEAGRNVRDTRTWLRADGSTLPEIGSSEAREIIRNWLACASPVVARTEFAPTAQLELTPCPTVEGETCVYSGPGGTLPDPTWSSIYASLIFSSCLTCHAPANTNMDQNPENPGGFIPGGASAAGLAALDLSGSDLTDTSNWASESHAAVFEAPPSANGMCAGNALLVDPDDAAGSLMIQKLRAVQTCGDEMPPAGGVQTISNSVIDVVEQWINLGAPND
ncbi:MAG: hypothetical protein AAF500_03050 [Myxococcota bacterium]